MKPSTVIAIACAAATVALIFFALGKIVSEIVDKMLGIL